MSFDFGFDFRQSAGFVTDPANCTYVLALGSDLYPQTRNGITFGWLVSPDGGAFDRSTGVDARLAGCAQSNNNDTTNALQVDLPATGLWTVDLALGDQGAGTGPFTALLKDNTTLLKTWQLAAIVANHYWDASEVERTSDANWAANHVTQNYTFATTTLILQIGKNQSGSTNLAHLRLTQSGGVPPPDPIIVAVRRTQRAA